MRPQCAFILRDAAKTPLLRMRESSELGADDHCRAHHITLLRHSGMRPLGAGPESILTIVVMDSGLALRAPRNDGLINRRLPDRRTKAGFEEIEIAALVGLFDMFGEHPAIAALQAALPLLPLGA